MPVRSYIAILFLAGYCTLELGCGAMQTPTAGVTNPVQFQAQPFQRPEQCLPCHQRQFDDDGTAVAGQPNGGIGPRSSGLAGHEDSFWGSSCEVVLLVRVMLEPNRPVIHGCTTRTYTPM